MDVRDALKFVEQLVYHHTGKYLNDLERDVFVGSWQGQTYEDIYPTNPEYVEKYVGYKLWQKLSTVCGEKVTKKQVRGAVERAWQRHSHTNPVAASSSSQVQHVFISCRYQEPDASLAKQLCEAIAAAGHRACMTAPSHETDWLLQLESNLRQCDYFLVLLSPQAAVSEMVLEELQHAKKLSRDHRDRPLTILPIWVNCPLNLRLTHDLQTFLQDLPCYEWHSPTDTPPLIQVIHHRLNGTPSPPLPVSPSSSSIPYLLNPLPSSPPLPTPTADPELPQGQVRLDSTFYIERVPYEAQCYREILQPGTLIRIKAPRQMGKTSLMSRILLRSREQGYHTVPLSFQQADIGIFASLDALLQWFCGKVARKLRLSHPNHYWTETYGSKDNCTMYFEDCLLSQIESPLVLGLDEVDRIFQYPNIADDFFGLLRAWYEEAGYGGSDSQLWEKLRLVVVHSTEVYIPLDVNQSPFNVGLPIELSEFSPQQVLDLATRHMLNWEMVEIETLMAIAGGHPYLIRLALYHLAQQNLTLPELVRSAATEAGIYGDHLRRHLWNLRQHPELKSAFSRVVNSDDPVELESILAFKLHSLGLVHLQGNDVTPRFNLYRQYFKERL
ncbi:hypothetical protein OsccyDRAFT_4402 [Leptolyngbyaceae cyanobacterium JSC-12]|nr:hypothetical protein OsccyDRAFT_4402 [Leptolyngbyaceae cyanobacterium JSC-12]